MNRWKRFATGLTIITSCLFSVFMEQFPLTTQSELGKASIFCVVIPLLTSILLSLWICKCQFI